ncbi:hypothetical protein FHS51_003430 [Sphingobium wenxiniae]|jgi:hypothetical protein|uniref:DUF6927 domain-containing protein n=1 Tax=Sphingobium wenxiniae (strain DSM 21828 / CGMCC 1.7748 / JZ-1) TaxID=595605 RepID=A0A562K874_SPHWJ|nr:hypothetical protein [Sphingobium wenxiniae]MBB6193174.1 hypothetical protein [Sphingobium wenxiniae]MBE5074934.1 hypothetical protein [Erythrobacteraceae bacterium E2-1 Yellow Sea]TWH91620.1 hypothetical protein IQ35_03133 [Sphingobium wenxiniae]
MGWLFMQGLGGYPSPRSYLDNQFTYSGETERATVLASAQVGSVYYAAVERIRPGAKTIVLGLICLTKYNPRARDGMTFGYKDMSEEMGPYEADCPPAILDLLTETDHPNALEWRAKCRANALARSLAGARPTPRPGQTIIFDPPLALTNGRTVARFIVIANPRGRGLRYRDPETGAVARIGSVKRFQYRLINPAIAAS